MNESRRISMRCSRADLLGLLIVSLAVIAVACLMIIGLGVATCGDDYQQALIPAIVLFALSVAAISVLYRPELLLGVFFAAMGIWSLLPASLDNLLSGFISPLTVVLAGIALMMRYGLPSISIGKTGMALLVFSAFLFVSTLWTSAPTNGLFKAQAFFLGTTALYFLVWRVYRRCPGNLWQISVAVALLSLVPVVVVLATGMRVGFEPARRTARAYFINNQSPFNVYGLSNGLHVGMICAMALYLKHRRAFRRWLWLFLVAANFYALILLSQRAQLLGSLLACGLLIAGQQGFRQFASSAKARINAKSLLLAGIVLLILLVLALANASKLNLSYMASDGNISSRLTMYVRALTGFLDRPLLGHGLGSFSMDVFGIDSRIFSHNILLDILYEGGLVCMAAFLVVLFRIATYARYIIMRPGVLSGVGLLGLALVTGRLFVAMFSADLSSVHLGAWLAMMVVAVSQARQTNATKVQRQD